ncbi:glycosyltransferase family 4 protein [Bradyrhizobium sp. ARR65]|uniref:glycosyltransferase family 4 protein n=1 Tax=Bradyrhizobium sp. ARR65 TaxID=1040989 RepID=UPI0004637A58|nr:glycosyltransferase family 4 protein [Bradyrhizobium sp. ARR65]
MNILLLTSEFSPANGGIGTYAREIAVAATELGANVTVVAPDYGKDRSADDRRLPFEIRRFKGGLHSMRDLPSKIALARRQIVSGYFDVVHAADWPFFIPLALARGLTQARILMTVHGTEINETQTPLKRLAIRTAGVFGSRTIIAANSRYTRDLFRQRFAVDSQRIHAIPLGVSDFWFGSRQTRAATRMVQGIGADRIVMVTVARLTRRKGHLLTLEALRHLPPELRRRLTWLLIGPDGEADYVAELRNSAAAADCDLRFLGTLSNEQIRDIYGASDFFCLTGLPESSGRVEGFGLVYLEAGAAALPSVATDIGGVPDAVVAGQSGLLVPPVADEIAQAITTLATDSATRSTLAAGALAHAHNLSWKRCAAETYGLTQFAMENVGEAAPPMDAALPRQLASARPAYPA